ncbi:MAG: co-chaperone GroES [Patescibacteria group bacterium]|nr:co-chaperone GroES [Patescibacteria group bacterium]MDE2172339.1 co-chaperone GroES [Patescibacteria group bacterium]
MSKKTSPKASRTGIRSSDSKAARLQQSGLAAKIRPLQDRVIIKESADLAEKKTATGIIIPATVNDDKGGKRGEIVAIGPGRLETTDKGSKVVPLSVEIGDMVIFQWGDKVRIDDEDYYIVREAEILAVIR